MISALAGLAFGLMHVLTGPDHLAAIAPLALDGRRRVWLTGLFWGVGHSSGVWVVGLLALALREVLSIESISAWSERLVGFLLIGIGLWALRKAFARRIHTHEHQHGREQHTHIHAHLSDARHDHPAAHSHTHAAFAVGILHGLAGSSHFLGILPALALPSTAAAITYVIAFGLGSVAGMTGFAWFVGLTSRLTTVGSNAYRNLMAGCAVVTVCIGVWWLFP